MFFATFGSLSCTIDAFHSIHYTHIKLSLAYPTPAEYSRVLLLAFQLSIMQFKRTICDQKFGSIALSLESKQSAILPQNAPFCI